MPATATATVPPTPDAAPRPATRHAARLEVVDGPDVVVRVLGLLRRRRCVVTAVSYAAGDRHRPGHLDVVYAPPARHESSVPGWLLGLVDVLAVEHERL